jgi:hypothetical protein
MLRYEVRPHPGARCRRDASRFGSLREAGTAVNRWGAKARTANDEIYVVVDTETNEDVTSTAAAFADA